MNKEEFYKGLLIEAQKQGFDPATGMLLKASAILATPNITDEQIIEAMDIVEDARDLQDVNRENEVSTPIDEVLSPIGTIA